MTCKKRIYAILCLVLFILFVSPLYIISVSAGVVYECDIPSSQPQISDNNGYIEVLFKNNTTGAYFVRVYSWFTNAIGNNVGDTWVDIYADSSGITLAPGYHIYDSTSITNATTCGARMTWLMVNTDGTIISGAKNQYYGDSSLNGQLLASSGSSVVGFRFYGNGRLVTNSITDSGIKFIINYSDTSTSIDTLRSLLSVVTDISYDVDTIDKNTYSIAENIIQLINNTDTVESKLQSCINYLTSINIGIGDVNAELDRIESSVDETEDKLDKIIEILESVSDNGVPEEVPKDSLNSHNSSESDLKGSISSHNGDSIDDFDFDADFLSSDSFLICWNIIEQVISTHESVLLIISVVLVLGLISLILNR